MTILNTCVKVAVLDIDRCQVQFVGFVYTTYPKNISTVKKARPRKCKLLSDLKM